MYLNPLRPRDASELCGDGVGQLGSLYNSYVSDPCGQAQQSSLPPCNFPANNQQCTSQCVVAVVFQGQSLEKCVCSQFYSVCPAPSPSYSPPPPPPPPPTSSPQPTPTSTPSQNPDPQPTSSDSPSPTPSPPPSSTPTQTPTIIQTSTQTPTFTSASTETQAPSESSPSATSVGSSLGDATTSGFSNTAAPTVGSSTSTAKQTSDGSSDSGHGSVTVSFATTSQYEVTLTISGSVVVETKFATSTGIRVLPSGSSADTTFPTSNDPSMSDQSAAQHHESNIGAIVGAVIAVILLLLLGLCLYRRRQRRNAAFAPSFQFVESLGPAIVVTSPAGVHDYDALGMSQSKANLLGRPTSEAPPAYAAPRHADGVLLEKEEKGPPTEEDGGYGVGYGHAV